MSPAGNWARPTSSSRRTRSARPRTTRPSTNHLSSSSLPHQLISGIQCRRPPFRYPRLVRTRARSALPRLRLRHSICLTSTRAHGAPAVLVSAYSPHASAAGSRIHSLHPLPTFLSLQYSRNTLLGAEHRRHHPRVQVYGRPRLPRRFSWLLGAHDPGWEGPPADALAQSSTQQRKEPRIKAHHGSWRSSSSCAASSSADGHSSPLSSMGHSSVLSTSASPTRLAPPSPGAAWTPAFCADLASHVRWLTYHSHLPNPIRDVRLADLPS